MILKWTSRMSKRNLYILDCLFINQLAKTRGLKLSLEYVYQFGDVDIDKRICVVPILSQYYTEYIEIPILAFPDELMINPEDGSNESMYSILEYAS